jgi:hypothetical protein
MEPKVIMYVAYLALSLLLTAWVARTLFHNGQVFLDDALGDERLARSVNHLLVVGFWLLNAGYVAVAIRVSGEVETASDAIETLSVKLGLVLLVVGAVHMFNVYVLSRFRRRRMLESVPPPVSPSGYLPSSSVPAPAPVSGPMSGTPAGYRPPHGPRPPAGSPWTDPSAG